jgi:hypothetical protein
VPGVGRQLAPTSRGIAPSVLGLAWNGIGSGIPAWMPGPRRNVQVRRGSCSRLGRARAHVVVVPKAKRLDVRRDAWTPGPPSAATESVSAPARRPGHCAAA